MGYNMLYLQYVDLSSSVYTHLSPTHSSNPTSKVNVHSQCSYSLYTATPPLYLH